MTTVHLSLPMRCALAALMLPGGAAVAAADHPVPPIPDKAEAEQFRDVPAPWRDYLLKARIAERIADPLARCLAYPDLPGNAWPEGHAEAHCRAHATTPMPMSELAGYVDGGRLEDLHARLDAMLARHFSEEAFGEDIHYLLDAFGDFGGEGDRLTARWLVLAPDSAYAHHARGVFLLGAAMRARGGAWASETPPEDMHRMSELVGQSIASLERAIELEPRLLPAYAMLHHGAMLDSRADVERKAAEAAWAIDPACVDMAKQRMQALQPRWGGSYPDMLAFATRLAPHVERRPGLALHVGAPWGDRGDRLVAADAYTREAADVLGIAISKGSNEDHLVDAAEVAFNRTDAEPENWKALSYLLQASRFREGRMWAERAIATMLVRTEPEWSLAHGYRALAKAEGDDLPRVHYYLGAGHYNSGNHAEAEKHYLLAATDHEILPDALAELAEMWLFHDPSDPKAGADRAEPHIDRLLASVPTSGIGWLLRLEQERTQERPIAPDVLRKFVEHADRDDPRQRDVLPELEKVLRALDRLIEAGPTVD